MTRVRCRKSCCVETIILGHLVHLFPVVAPASLPTVGEPGIPGQPEADPKRGQCRKHQEPFLHLRPPHLAIRNESPAVTGGASCLEDVLVGASYARRRIERLSYFV